MLAVGGRVALLLRAQGRGDGAGSWLGQENPGFINHNQRNWNKSIGGTDVAHHLAFNYQWELPFGEGRRWLSSGGLANQLIGGWVINGITTLQSGLPLAIRSRRNTLGNFGGTQMPFSTGISSVTDGNSKQRYRQWFNPAAFEQPAAYTYGNVGPFLPSNRGPGYQQWDISILKNFPITERVRLQFRGELFNAFNQVNFRSPRGTALQFGRANFGRITSTEAARIIQFGLKLYC